MDTKELKATIQDKYGRAGLKAKEADTSCCGPTSCGSVVTKDLYGKDELRGLPTEAVAASLGCGNPTALAQLKPGEVVLDLGSGGGIDVLLSAKRVGPPGKAHGLAMPDEMLALARGSPRQGG